MDDNAIFNISFTYKTENKGNIQMNLKEKKLNAFEYTGRTDGYPLCYVFGVVWK